MLYNRLESLKAIGDRLAAQRAEIVNPLALKLGLDDVGGPLSTTGDDSNSAVHFYDHLLSLCEKLFDNEIDQSAFEEAMRFMFGTRAFISFTLDKLVAAVVKQVRPSSQHVWKQWN
jgi:paired amphipathic helix protein Sin3a